MVRAPTALERDLARRETIGWATRLIAGRDTLFVDTETTGLDGQAEVIEIAVVDGRGRALLDTLVRPAGRIPPEASRIHGILDATVAAAPRWDDVYPRLRRLLANGPVVVYNAEFDLRLVNQMNRRFGYPPLPDSWHCAMRRYGAYASEWNAKYGNYRLHRLEAALATFGHPPTSHRAAGDANACRLVVQGMAATRHEA